MSRPSLAIPKHLDWYFEDFIKKNVHPDSTILEVGATDGSLMIKVKNILKAKGLKERKKAGAPEIQKDPDFKFQFEDNYFDVVILSWVLNRPNKEGLQVLREAARVGRKFVLVQCDRNEGWLNLLSSVGCIETETLWPEDKTLIVTDVSTAPTNYEPKVPPAAPSILDSEPPPPPPEPQSPHAHEKPYPSLTHEQKDRMLARFADDPKATAVIQQQPVVDSSKEEPEGIDKHIHFFDADKVLSADEETAGYTTSGWYFPDEAAMVFGPYDTPQIAQDKFKEYHESLDFESALAADAAYGSSDNAAPIADFKTSNHTKKVERTLLIIKPDASVKREDIIKFVLARGLKILRQTFPFTFTREWADMLYSEHQGKSFYEEHVSFMCSGKCAIYELEGVNAVASLRQLAGATDPVLAEPYTLRRLFGTKLPQNAVHTSDSVTSAQRELSYFFPPAVKLMDEGFLDTVKVSEREHFMDSAEKTSETISSEEVGHLPEELLKGK